MRLAFGISVIGLALLVSGCAGFMYAPVVPPRGSVVNNTTAPLGTNLTDTDLGTRRGESSTQCVLGVIAWGDGGVHQAAKNGGLQTIKYADYEFFTVMGVYSRYTTIVYGD